MGPKKNPADFGPKKNPPLRLENLRFFRRSRFARCKIWRFTQRKNSMSKNQWFIRVKPKQVRVDHRAPNRSTLGVCSVLSEHCSPSKTMQIAWRRPRYYIPCSFEKISAKMSVWHNVKVGVKKNPVCLKKPTFRLKQNWREPFHIPWNYSKCC